jgi:nickel-dependent lactate racemase
MEIELPYGEGKIKFNLEKERIAGVILPRMHDYNVDKDQETLVRDSLENPIGSTRLSQLTQEAETITVITSDHTRPLPSKITMPLILEEIRRGNPEAKITILIATGCHRPPTEKELGDRFGKEIVEKEEGKGEKESKD